MGEKKIAQDPDVKDKKGTQPKKYYKTLSKSEKEKRAKHFSKQDYEEKDIKKIRRQICLQLLKIGVLIE